MGDFMEFLIAAVGSSSQYTFDEFMAEFGDIVKKFSPRRVSTTEYIGGDNSMAIKLNSLADLIFLRKSVGKEICISEFVKLSNGEKMPLLMITNF